MKPPTAATFLLGLCLFSCLDASETSSTSGSIKSELFGQLPGGSDVKIFTLTNTNGMIAKVTGLAVAR